MQREIVDAFHIEYESSRAWEKLSWLGVPMYKLPFDAFILAEIIWSVKPHMIIETGTCRGGSALFYASLLSLLGEGVVLTIDKENKWNPPETIPSKIINRIYRRIADSVDPKVLKEIKETQSDFYKDPCMVILDSWHTKDHVAKELELYSPLVSVGSYLVVEDTHVSSHPVPWKWGEGPYEAVQEFLAKRDDFVVDTGCERLGITFNPSGYLRRVK